MTTTVNTLTVPSTRSRETIRRLLRSLHRSWAEGAPVTRIGYLVSAVLFASGLVHLATLVISGGTWEGPLSLRKPTTFGLSFGLTLASVLWAGSFVPLRPRTRDILAGLFTVASVTEVALVTMQAWRGEESHFNFKTGFDSAVSMTLAGGGAVILVVVLGFTLAALRGATASPGMRLALRAGFLSLLVALGVGAAMIAKGVTLARLGHPELAYTTAGQLKPAHAVAMHAILVLPAIAWLLGFTGWSARRQLIVVWIATAGYALLLAIVTVESVAGVSPLDAPPVAVLGSTAALLALLIAGTAALYGALSSRSS